MALVAEESAPMGVEQERDHSGQVTARRQKLYLMYYAAVHCGKGATCVLLRRNTHHVFEAQLTSHVGNIVAASKDWCGATAAQSFLVVTFGCRQM
jgi:hypothetical protein